MKKSSTLSVIKSKTPKVYKSKKLNNANFGDFTHTDYQVFLYLVSKIGGVDECGKYLQPEKIQREHSLTAKEFSKLFNVSLSNCYGILKKAVDRLMKVDIQIRKPEDNGFWRINVCSMAEYNIKDGYISVKFTDDIMPYLAQVREKFILYNLKEIAKFGSLYTTRLYELIQEFQETGWLLKSVQQLREIFAVGSSFKLYGDFKRYTFVHACQEINYNYNMGLRFEEIKEGRKVVAVKFFFKQTIVNQVTNQKTGKTTNIYTKPKDQLKTKRKMNSKLSSSQENLEGQLSFEELKPETTSIKSLMSSFLSKFTSSKK
jgi:plasmid replication initiation protein